MTTVHRLKATGAVLALAVAVTTTYVWGDAKNPSSGGFLSSRNDPAPLKSDQSFTEEAAETKFSSQPVVIYQTTTKDTLFGLQVKPELAKAAERPRDLAIVIDTSASQARNPIEVARQITDALIQAVQPADRVSIWTVNTPAATRDLTRGFQPANSAPVQEAVKFLKQDVPFGDTDLKAALQRVIDAFENRLGRQRVIVFLGDGMSLHNPISNEERLGLCDQMIAKEITFYSVPLGIRLDSGNLHGLATGSGGLLVRSQLQKSATATATKLLEAIAAPVFYTRKIVMPAEVSEFYPTKLPPLRTDVPTLIVGKIKPNQTLDYAVEGKLGGKDERIKLSVRVPSPELDNFFLVGMVEQWSKAENRAVPTPFRADRALALSFEKCRLAREELLAQAQWALAADNLQAAAGLFEQAKKLDPATGEAEAGIKIINALREGKLTRKEMREQLGNLTGQAIRIENRQVVRDQFRNLLAQAENRMPERMAANNDLPEQDNFLRDQRQRLAAEEQRIAAMVNDVERQANRLLETDPDAAHDLLKRTLQSIRDNVDLSPQTRQNLISRLEGAVRSIDIRGARIKQDLLDRQLALARSQEIQAQLAERQRAEEQIIRRMKAFDELMDQGRFNEAYREALVMQQDTINRGLEVDNTMVAAYAMGLTGTHLREVQEIKRASEERWLLTMLSVEKSHIPFPDEPPVEFPPAATWQKLTERRLKAGYDSAGLGEDQEGRLRAQEIQSKLKRPVNLDKGIDPNTPLKDALEFLSDRYDMTIIIDNQAFEAIGVQKPEETAVQLPRMVGVSLATVLRLLLNQVKGDVYKGTYIVRRDYIEVTTTYHAAAEKVIRAYPVADLVIAIPNSVNQQALQQSLAVYGQFVNSSPAYIGGAPFAGGIGGLGVAGAAAAGAPGPGYQQGFNPFQFQGGVPGNNQYGNLGGQFGLQGQDTSFELLQLIVNVVAPGEWQPLFQQNPQSNPGQAAPAGLLPGALAPPGQAGGVMPEPTVSTELLNAVGYYQPARALIIRGSSRTHSRLEGGITARPGAAPVMGGANFNRPGGNAVVIKPGQNRDGPPAKDGPKDPKAVVQEIAKNVDPRTAWQEALTRTKAQAKNGLVDPGLIIACADFLVQTRKFEHAAELLKATLREGVVAEPWVFQSLAVALQLANASADEVERAQLSAIDLAPQNAQSYMDAAKGMAELKRYDVAVALCRQGALMEPGAPAPYANALAYAQEGRNSEGMAWAAGNLLRQEWPLNNDDLHGRAKSKLDDLTREMTKSSNLTGAQKLQQALQQAYRRDLVISLTWQGEADLDLKVKEAGSGTVCSFADRQTAGGGILVGDILPAGETVKQWKETYVAAEAFSGEFEISVDRTWGRPVGAKAILEIVRHQGTPNETRERHSLSFDQAVTPIKVVLKDGRRVSIAQLPSPAALAVPSATDAKNPSIDVLSKLRSMTDPMFSGNLVTSGIRGDVRSTGTESARVSATKAAPQPDRVAINTKMSNFVSGAMDVVAQTTINPNQREMRVRMNPVFLNRNGAQPAAANPLVPGGF